MNITHTTTTHRNTLAALAAASLLTLGLATATPASAADFEGRIDMTMSNPESGNQSTAVIAVYIKTPKIRMETTEAVDAGSGGKDGSLSFVVIRNTETSESYMIMPEQKMYIVIKDEKGGNVTGSSQSADAYEPTGRTQTILGYRAMEYASTGGGSYTEMWLATGLGKFLMTGSQQDKKAPPKGWEKFLEDNNLFPLKVTEYKEKGGSMTYQLEVTRIDQGSQPDSLFEPPADYQKLDPGGMFDSLKESLGAGLKDAAKEAASPVKEGVKEGVQEAKEETKQKAKESVKEKVKKSILDRLKF